MVKSHGIGATELNNDWTA